MTAAAINTRPRLNRAGTTALEYGLRLPVFLLFLLGIMDLGRLMWVFMALNRATEAAARCAAVNAMVCGSVSQIQSDAATQAWGLTVPASTFSVSDAACGVQVAAAYRFNFFTPGLGSITLAPSACFTSQLAATGAG
jgi:Flp pilus assembly protein TadG